MVEVLVHAARTSQGEYRYGVGLAGRLGPCLFPLPVVARYQYGTVPPYHTALST